MATTNSTEYANVVATPTVFNRTQFEHGGLRVRSATYTFAAQASGDIINLFKLPAGARVLFFVAGMTATHGGTATVKIGDAADDDKFRLAATLTAAATILPQVAAWGATDSAAVVGADAPYTAETLIFLTIGAASLPGSGRARLDCVYVLD